jgi:hypothetical protein
MQTKQTVVIETDLHRETAFRYEILVLLPEPVAQGAETRLRVKWQAKWRNTNLSTGRRQLGVTTGMQPYLPELLPAPGGTVWKTKTRLGIPPRGIKANSGAVSGVTKDETVAEDGWRWVVAESANARAAAVGVGKWADYAEPSAKDLPGVRVHLFTGDAWGLQEFPPEVRRVVTFLERFLPKYPEEEVEVVQTYAGSASMWRAFGWHPQQSGVVGLKNFHVSGVTDVGKVAEIRKTLTQQMVARQVAHQYWGQSIGPNSSRDAWLTHALAEAFAVFYLRSAVGMEHYDAWIGRARDLIEAPKEALGQANETKRLRRPFSLTSASGLSDISHHVVGRYGFFLVAHQLRQRVGNDAFFRALDRLARRRAGKWITTDDLQAVMEETSGVDLADFFDYWVHGGRVPEVTVHISRGAGEGPQDIAGCITTDQPFGSFDLPVRITDKDGEREAAALVDVDDGVGRFKVPARHADAEVEVDPDRQLLLYKRVTKVVKALPDACAEPAKTEGGEAE